MRLLHVSDLHMVPAVSRSMEARVLEQLVTTGADISVVTGDLTYGKQEQFARARSFIDRLPGRKIVVPGNTDHSIAYAGTYTEGTRTLKARKVTEVEEAQMTVLREDYRLITLVQFNGDYHWLLQRAQAPPPDGLHYFKQHFGDLTSPIIDQDVAITGIDSTRMPALLDISHKGVMGSAEVLLADIYDGAIDEGDAEAAIARARSKPAGRLDIVALHHPLTLPRWSTYFGPFHKGDARLKEFAGAGVQMILAGHKHVPGIAVFPPGLAAGPVYHVTANTLFSNDIKQPYTMNSYYTIDKQGSSAWIVSHTVGGPAALVGAFTVT